MDESQEIFFAAYEHSHVMSYQTFIDFLALASPVVKDVLPRTFPFIRQFLLNIKTRDVGTLFILHYLNNTTQLIHGEPRFINHTSSAQFLHHLQVLCGEIMSIHYTFLALYLLTNLARRNNLFIYSR